MKHPFSYLSVLCLLAAFCACSKNDNNSSTPAVKLSTIADGLVSPVVLAEPPDSSHRLFIVDQTGKIWILGSDGKMLASPFIDISSKMVALNPGYDERGLLGLAFHPQYKTNGKFYLFYTAPPRPGTPVPAPVGSTWDNLTRISEFKVSASGANQADPNSERVLLEEDHPYNNHNGGTLAFGPDGYLYISIGDGGNKDDVGNGHVEDWYKVNAGGNGQDIYHNRMGDLLRIDVNTGNPYGIPADNPFAGTAAKPEIYAYGFRNPYRFSFDKGGSHALLLGDVGQSLYEEIDYVVKGGNYGWNVREGAHCFSTDNDLQLRPSCPTADSSGKRLIDPFVELPNTTNPAGGGVGTAIVGGFVYRGSTLPASWQGQYVFGTFSTSGGADGKIFTVQVDTGATKPFTPLSSSNIPFNLGAFLKGIGQDQRGEIYLLTSGQTGPQGNTGKVWKMVPA
jgi:glucose/arabinose dehydrogenase